MSIFIVKNGKKTLPRSFYFKILIFFGLIGSSVVGMMPLQAALGHGMKHIRDNFIQKMEDISGLEISYSSIRPVLLNSFDVRDLKFEKEEKQLFTVSRIRIKYSILELLLGKKTFIHTVIIENPILEIDAQKDKDTLNLLSSLFKRKKEKSSDSGAEIDMRSLSDLLPVNADYQIQNGYFLFVDEGKEYRIEGMNMLLKEEDSDIFLDGHFSSTYKFASPFEKYFIFKTDVNIEGICSSDFESAKADVNIFNAECLQQNIVRKNTSFFKPPAVRTEKQELLFSVNPFSVKLAYEDHLFSATGNESEAPINYLVKLNAQTGAVSAEFNFNDYMFGESVIFSDYLDNLAHLLLLKVEGFASFRYENKKSFVYNANIKSGDTDRAKTNPLTDAFLLNAYGREDSVRVRDLLISSSVNARKTNLFQGKVEFSGDINFDNLRVNGDLGFDHFSLSGNDSITADFEILTRRNEIQMYSETIIVAQTQINDFDLILIPSRNDIAAVFSCSAENEGVIAMDALYDKNQKQLEASLSLKKLSLYEITEYISPFSDFIALPSVSGRNLKKSFIDADIFVQTDTDNIVYNAPNITLTFADKTGRFAVSGTDKRLTLSEGVLTFDKENELFISSNINFSDPKDLFFDLNAGFKDLTWNVEGQILDRSTLIVRDPNGLNIYGNTSSTGELSGYIEGRDYPLLINSKTFYVNLYGALRYVSADFWNFDITRFAISDPNAGGTGEVFKISGSADQDGASFREIVYGDSVGLLAGSADFRWDSDFSYVQFTANITDGREIGEHYFIDGSVKGKNVDINASVSDLHLNRYVKNINPLLLSADMKLSWNSIDSFEADIDVKSLRTRINEETLFASVNVNLNNDELRISNLRMDAAGIKGTMPEFKVNRSEGFARARADISGKAAEKNVESRIDIDFNFMQVDSWTEIARVLDDFSGTLAFVNVRFGEKTADDIVFKFAGNRGAFSVHGGIRDMLRLEMESDGTFYAGLSSPFPIQGTVIGEYSKGTINADCGNFFLDLSSLYSLFSRTDDFDITGGYIRGNMKFRGPVLNPEMHGTGTASSMRFRVPGYISEDLCPTPFTVAAEGYEMTFGPVVTAVGSGGGSISGWLFFENWRPVKIGLDVKVPQESPIPYDFNITGFLAEGKASGNVAVNVDNINFLIEIDGTIFTNNTDLGINMDDLGSGSGGGHNMYSTSIDLTITTGSIVEFKWPANNPIIRASPETGTVIAISSDTLTGQFSINSDVKIRSGELFYVNRNFFIRQGSIIFKETESNFNPMFSVRADIRDRVDAGPVVISMIVDNQPLLKFNPRFESSPSLTQLEIYSILGQNFGVAQGEENSDQANRFLLTSTTDVLTHLIGTSDVLSQFVFFRQFERQVRDTLRLDMFSVRTRFLQNLAVSGTTGFGQTPVDRSNRVGNYFDNTSVFIGKYIGKHMFISGMLTARYDENSNFLGGVRIEPDIGIELDSPFVNIRWDFFPYNPQNWWVTDHSITLSWSMSF